LIHVTGAIAPAYAGDFTLFEVGSFNSDSRENFIDKYRNNKTGITSKFRAMGAVKTRTVNISRRDFIKVMRGADS
jgi:hypothetical protein